ncbi:TIGR04222 domain-containing membrane protein [Actinokineospora sp. NBRC 105648]|uniref:TIGR04222 domain-containing membrane protein n=1 Tax=Actinokineospora sp. NBRC 105648 TaxID=3032206 RepID=UPI0024A10E82|nr:TIGR04222 domain-containing membrane protein [Actinokineospora sp. NBRC 105648]GLZ38962.1 hypothetical protein Acsp05_25860 [Actinokineospora sp. NBRC 105648]
MNEPWGIAGPDFLRVYLVGAAFAILIAGAVRIMARTGAAAHRTGTGQLTVAELAYLAGGARRVVELSVARLLDAGKLRPSRGGRVQAVEGAASGTDPVDRAVLAETRRHKHRSVSLVVDRVVQLQAVTSTADALVAKGLLVDRRAARARLSAAPIAVLFAVGLVRWVNGVSQGRPVGWLSVALLGTLVLLVAVFRTPVPERTYAGTRRLAEARQAARHSRQAPPADPRITDYALVGGVAGMVALGGLASYPDADIASALEFHRVPAAYAAGGGPGGSSAGCGAVTGGGSCAGGGGDGGGSSGCGGGGGCGG